MVIEVEVQVLPAGFPHGEEALAGAGSDAALAGGSDGISRLAPATSARDVDLVQSELLCAAAGRPTLPRFSIPQERLCSLFPFHILLDSSGSLVQVSIVSPPVMV